jgi:hypothetical protein
MIHIFIVEIKARGKKAQILIFGPIVSKSQSEFRLKKLIAQGWKP